MQLGKVFSGVFFVLTNRLKRAEKEAFFVHLNNDPVMFLFYPTLERIENKEFSIKKPLDSARGRNVG